MSTPLHNPERHLNRHAIGLDVRSFLRSTRRGGRLRATDDALLRDARAYMARYVDPMLVNGYTLEFNDDEAMEVCRFKNSARAHRVKLFLKDAGVLILKERQHFELQHGVNATSKWLVSRTYIEEKRKTVKRKSVDDTTRGLKSDLEAIDVALNYDPDSDVPDSKQRLGASYIAEHRRVRLWAVELATLSLGDGGADDAYFWRVVQTYHTRLLEPAHLLRAAFRNDAIGADHKRVREAMPVVQEAYEAFREAILTEQQLIEQGRGDAVEDGGEDYEFDFDFAES